MALNIAANQQPVNVVDQFIEGRALRQAEDMRTQQMTALQNAEGRAQSQDVREQGRYDDERKANQIKFDEIGGKRTLARVQQVMALPKEQRKAYIQQNAPEYVAEFEKQRGEPWADISDDEIEEQGSFLVRKISGDLGLSPEVYKAQSEPGRVAADVKNKLLTQGQGDAILNAEKFTPLKEGVIDGQPSVYQVGEKTGEKRVIEGVTPLPKSPLVSIDQRARGAGKEEFAKLEATELSEFLKKGQDSLDKAESIRVLMDNDALTGPTQDLQASAFSLFRDLGIDIPEDKIKQIRDLGQYQGIVAQNLIKEKAEQKGVATKEDADVMARTFAKTTNIPEANKLILRYRLALAEREGLLADKAEDYKNEKDDVAGWRKNIRQYVRETPLVGKNKDTGEVVFWNEYLEKAKEINPGATEEKIMASWKKNYGNR